MDISLQAIPEVELAQLEDTKAGPVAVSDRLLAIVGERPALQIDITDAGTVFAAHWRGVAVTAASADAATRAVAPQVAAVNRAGKLQRDAQAAAAQAMVDIANAVVGAVMIKAGG